MTGEALYRQVELTVRGRLAGADGCHDWDHTLRVCRNAELLLAEKHVAVVPGIAFEAEGFCRLSYAISTEKIEEGLSRIAAFIQELK